MSMKKLLSFYAVLLIVISSQAQKTDKQTTSSVSIVSAKDLEKLPFSRGINNFTIQQNFGFSHRKPENSDNNTSSIDLKLDYNRFIVDGFALGAGIDFSSDKTEFGANEIKNTEVIFSGNAIYGHTFNGNFNLYGKASVGFGSAKTTYTGTPSTISKGDLFGYSLEVGTPIHLYSGGGNYITPFIRYGHLQHKEGGEKNSINQFSLGFNFQNYSASSGYQCDCKKSRGLSANAYGQGRSFIGYSSMGNYGFGKFKTEFGNLSDETDISGGEFNLEYGYYVARDIALGAGLSWSNSSEGEGSDKDTESEFSFMPMITLNAPSKDCLENLFLQGGYGFGVHKFESGSSENKFNTTNLSINLGYNLFFGKYLAFTPKIGYESETSKHTENNVKTKQSGFQVGFGCSLYW